MLNARANANVWLWSIILFGLTCVLHYKINRHSVFDKHSFKNLFLIHYFSVGSIMCAPYRMDWGDKNKKKWQTNEAGTKYMKQPWKSREHANTWIDLADII